MKKQTKDILLYSFDIDGTSNKNSYSLHILEEEFLHTKSAFPKIFIDSLVKRKTQNNKVRFMITTGRSLDLVEPLLKEVPKYNGEPLFTYLACVNGAFVYKWSNNEYKLIKKFDGMSFDVACKVLKVTESLNLPMFININTHLQYYVKKNWNDEKYRGGLDLKKWSNNHITYEQFYNLDPVNIIGMVIDTNLIGRPPLNDSQKYIYSEEQIHKHQRNRFNDKFMFSKTLKHLHRINGVPKRTSVLISGPNSVDISVITKADALKTVISDFGITREFVSHSGDNFNDLPAWRFLRSSGLEDIELYGKKRGLVNAMSNAWDHLKLVTGDKIVETSTVSDFVELTVNYDNIKHFLVWDKTGVFSKSELNDKIMNLNKKYRRDNIIFERISLFKEREYYNFDRNKTMILQINNQGVKTKRVELKNYVKKLQHDNRLAKIHVYYDSDIKI